MESNLHVRSPPLLLSIALICAICIGVSYESESNPLRFYSQSEVRNPILHRVRIAKANTARLGGGSIPGRNTRFIPGSIAAGFKLPTLDGDLVYPGPVIKRSTPVIFHSYNPNSAFLQCLWNCSGSVEDFVKTSPRDVHYVFMSSSNDAIGDVRWMKERLRSAIEYLTRHEAHHRESSWSTLAERLHFVTVSTWALRDLGVWIPDLLRDWTCQDHNCGIDQVLIQSADMKGQQLVLPRLDARYDWLPLPPAVFNNKTIPAKVIGDGCSVDEKAKGVIAIISEKNCDYFVKVQSMSKSGALGVLVIQDLSSYPPDMNCNDDECNVPLNIPASTIPNHPVLAKSENLTIQYRNLVSENFFAAIDQNGKLAEVGWLLHPALVYLPWQAQWFDYRKSLDGRLSQEAFIVNIFNNSVMHGDQGASVNVTLPPLSELQNYNQLELDFSMSCPGERDEDCPHWDRTIQLYVCCAAKSSPLCGAELGRWISPFRRRIGRWLTSTSSLLPLLESQQCTFTVGGALANEPWMPTLNLRFSKTKENMDAARPTSIKRWINGTFTFDKNYNKHFNELTLKFDRSWKQVKIFSVITGHGSDENGCGEFCITSHHFVINNRHLYNRTFNNAGTPLGCAERVPLGVEPNEHGTWLYGRNGWCDGQQVDPWVIDITNDLDPTSTNVISYFGWFRGGDPDPKQNPGVITINTYIVMYE